MVGSVVQTPGQLATTRLRGGLICQIAHLSNALSVAQRRYAAGMQHSQNC